MMMRLAMAKWLHLSEYHTSPHSDWGFSAASAGASGGVWLGSFLRSSAVVTSVSM